MPLEKSYSDSTRPNKVSLDLVRRQDNTTLTSDCVSLQRKQWQRSKSNPAAQPAAAPKPKPPLPVTEKTKNKLQAFQFEPAAAEPDPVGKEETGDSTVKKETKKKKDWLTKREQSSSSETLSDNTRAPAPAARPTWQDLLGKSEETKKGQDSPPTERITWIHDKNCEPLPSMSPVLPRKARKRRARSSSPISSPAAKLAATPALGRNKRTQLLKTPRADPTIDLWDRFSRPAAAAADTSPSALGNPLINQLLVSSSPHPARDANAPGTGRPLRKSISLGSNWPKRRKLSQMDEDDDVVVKAHPLSSTSKSFMVSAILETVDDELRKSNSTEVPAQHPLKPSSPERPASSPLAQKSTRPDADVSMRDSFNKKLESDYGDDDFDDDTFMELEASIIPPIHEDDPTLVASSQDDLRAQASKKVSHAHLQALPVDKAVNIPQAQPATEVFEEDDFGDLDDDFFDEAENLVAKVEAKHLTKSHPRVEPQVRQQDEEGEDDPYGDDFGDVDFDAIEFAATQAVSSTPSNPFSAHVRKVQ